MAWFKDFSENQNLSLNAETKHWRKQFETATAELDFCETIRVSGEFLLSSLLELKITSSFIHLDLENMFHILQGVGKIESSTTI